jgi:hypothetical protein
MSMKNPIDTIGNRTRDLPACSLQIAITDNVGWAEILGTHYDFSHRALTAKGWGWGGVWQLHRVAARSFSAFHNPATYTFLDSSFLRYLKKGTEKKTNLELREAVTGP